MLGVDVVGEKTADEFLGPEKAKGGQAVSKADSDFKNEDEEELPAWQNQPAIPEFYADPGGSSTGSRYACFRVLSTMSTTPSLVKVLAPLGMSGIDDMVVFCFAGDRLTTLCVNLTIALFIGGCRCASFQNIYL